MDGGGASFCVIICNVMVVPDSFCSLLLSGQRESTISKVSVFTVGVGACAASVFSACSSSKKERDFKIEKNKKCVI